MVSPSAKKIKAGINVIFSHYNTYSKSKITPEVRSDFVLAPLRRLLLGFMGKRKC